MVERKARANGFSGRSNSSATRRSSGWYNTTRRSYDSGNRSYLSLDYGGRRVRAGLGLGYDGIRGYYYRDRYPYRRHRYYGRLGVSYWGEFYGGSYYPYGRLSYYDLYYHRYPYDYLYTHDYYPTWTVYVEQPAVETVYVEQPAETVYRSYPAGTVAAGVAGEVLYAEESDGYVGPPARDDSRSGAMPPVVNGEVQVEPQQRIPVNNEYLANGARAFREGNYAEARQALMRAVLDEPGNGFTELAYGLCHFALGDYVAAGGALRRGLSLVPDVVDLPIDITRQYGKADDFDQHLQALGRHVDAYPDQRDPWLVLGYVYYSSGNPAEAVKALNKAVSIDAGDTHAAILRDAATRVRSVPKIGG